MRTIQKLSVRCLEDDGNTFITIFTIRLPKDSKILSFEQDGAEYIFWYHGTTEDRCAFEDYILGVFRAEDPLPDRPMRFHSAVKGYFHQLFLYEIMP